MEMNSDDVEFEFRQVASDEMTDAVAQVMTSVRRDDEKRVSDERDAMRKRIRSARETEVNQVLAVQTAPAPREVKIAALAGYLGCVAGERGGTVAVDRFGLTLENLVDIFSSEKVNSDWKRNRLMFRNCGDCSTVKYVTSRGVAEMYGLEGCAWRNWFPLEYCDILRRWPWRWHSADAESDLIPQMMMAEDQRQYDGLRERFLEDTEAKCLFHLLENGRAGADDAFVEQHMSFVGPERASEIVKRHGNGMVMSLAYLYGMQEGGSMRSRSDGPVDGLVRLDGILPGTVASARDCFGNDAQLYLLAGYGAAAAPCDNGHDNFDLRDLDGAREKLENLGCAGDAKNEFGFSARELYGKRR